MMKLIKSVLAIAMALAMAMSLLPMSVMADDGDITEENDASVRVQELLNALPEIVTAENAAEVKTLLGEIDSLTVKLELSDEQWAVYKQASAALDELANNNDSEPENEPETVDVDVDKGEEATKKTYTYSGTTYYYIELTNTSFKVGNKNTPITTKVASLSVEGSEIEEYYDTETREGEGYAIARRWYSVQMGSSYKYTEENAPTNENKPIGDGEVGLVASDYKKSQSTRRPTGMLKALATRRTTPTRLSGTK